MSYQALTNADHTIIELLPEAGVIASERDALDWIAVCGEHRAQGLLIHTNHLTPEFFRLSTGVAGSILLKFTTYHVRLAAVLSPDLVKQGRFGEFAYETNRGNDFRIFYERQKAVDWLFKVLFQTIL
jgi:PadR family transcriptional regulator, regulatory protein AphA